MRLGIGCGCFTIILGIALLVGLMVLPSIITDNENLNRLMGQIFCGNPAAYVNQSSSYSTRPGSITYTLNAGCRRDDESIEDITGIQGLVGVGGFILLLFTGIGIISISVARGAINKTRQWAQTAGVTISATDSPLADDRYARRLEIVGVTPTASSNNSILAQRLRELETSYEEGLLTRDEYDDARKRLIDQFSRPN